MDTEYLTTFNFNVLYMIGKKKDYIL